MLGRRERKRSNKGSWGKKTAVNQSSSIFWKEAASISTVYQGRIGYGQEKGVEAGNPNAEGNKLPRTRAKLGSAKDEKI